MAIGRIPEPGTGIQESIVDAKGDLISATGNDAPARLAVGANGTTLVADSGEATGLKYQAPTVNTVVDAKGDLLAGTADNTIARLAVGTDGQVLIADSNEATGLKFATPAGGGGLTLISTNAFSGTNIVLSAIAGTFKNLHCEVTGVFGDNATQELFYRLNADTGTKYDFCRLGSQGSSSDFQNVNDQTSVPLVNSGTNSGANEKSSAFLSIYNYAQTTVPVIFTSFGRGKQSTNFKGQVVNGQYRNTANITSITFLATAGNFSGGSVRLYGGN